MRIIARSTLRSFWQQYPDAEQPSKHGFMKHLALIGKAHQILKVSIVMPVFLLITALFLTLKVMIIA